MAILNYTTKIDPAKTAAEIQNMLGAKGAQSVSTQYIGGEAVAVYFAIEVNGRMINFKLPCNWEGVYAVIQADRKIPQSLTNPEQAKRVAWRIVKDWVEAQLAIIESGQAEMAEVFLPYATVQNGQTLFQKFNEKPQLMLGT